MFCKQILSFKRNHKHKSSIGKCQKNMADNKLISLTLKVENASEATSKVGNSTNLKNNSKLADSKMYLKNHYKFNCMKRWKHKGAHTFFCKKKTYQNSGFHYGNFIALTKRGFHKFLMRSKYLSSESLTTYSSNYMQFSMLHVGFISHLNE